MYLPQRSHFVGEFEGLRGLMAWWVVVDHMTEFAGYSGQQKGLSAIIYVLLHSSVPVDVFITLSGFVIFMLLDRSRKEGYPAYLHGRFFRLYPTYLVSLIFAVLVLPLLPTVLAAPWGDASYLSDGIARLQSQSAAIPHHIALHLTLLHGLVPDQWFEFAGASILGPAWSLSLEWQFYLIAPFLFYSLSRGFRYLAAICIFVLLLKIYFLSSDLTFNYGGFLPLKFEYFMLGMGSYLVWREVVSSGQLKKASFIFFGLLLMAYILMFFTGGMREHFFPISIWLVVFYSALLRVRSGGG